MRKLSILLALFLLVTIFAVSNTYVRAAGAGGAGVSAECSGGSFVAGSPDSFGMETRSLQPYYAPGTNTGRDNDQPGMDMRLGSTICGPSATGPRCKCSSGS